MTTYFSTFITGFDELVQSQLHTDIHDICIDLLLDGLVTYTTKEVPQRIRNLRYLNNSFILLKQISVEPQDKLEDSIKSLVANIDFKEEIQQLSLPVGTTFRLIVSKENQLTGVKKTVTRKIESRILSKTHLQLNPLKADLEFWFLIRSEGQAFFGIRITGLAGSKVSLEKGALRPELAHLLCLLSKPGPDDTFLDPFCGSGSIPIERGLCFPYKQIIASDDNSTLIEDFTRTASTQDDFKIIQMDARTLDEVKNQSIDKIVTDPPWDFYNTASKNEMDLEKFHEDMLKSFTRVIKPTGTIVILTARKDILEDALSNQSPLHLKHRYDILVSGKKAGVYVLRGSKALRDLASK